MPKEHLREGIRNVTSILGPPPPASRDSCPTWGLHTPGEGVAFPTRSRVTRDLFSRTHRHTSKVVSGQEGSQGSGRGPLAAPEALLTEEAAPFHRLPKEPS